VRATATAGGGRPKGAPFGLRRFPRLTTVVFALTAAMSLAQLADPSLLGRLERTPAELHGDWWRIVTALFVQDGGVIGAVSNLAFLAVIGAIAEQILSWPRWLAHYFGVGILTELIATEWQPVGGGNSIAVCGLTGAVAVAAWRENARLPRATPQAVLLWCGALLGTLFWPLIVVGVAAAAVARRRQEQHAPVLRATALGVAATGIALAIATNIHGAALLAGIVLAQFSVPRSIDLEPASTVPVREG
jgi:membrane associated rhomboid family serine protease